MSLEELLNVEIITSGKQLEKVREVPASVIIINRQDIERNGYSTLADILDNVPGVYTINGRDAFGTVYGIRGYWSGWPRNFVVMVNGIEQESAFEIYHSQNTNMPVEAIDRIEIIKGPMSVMYGSGAFLGAINIITNESDVENQTSLISGAYGSDNTRSASIRYAELKDDYQLIFNAGFYDTDGPDEPLSKYASNLELLETGFGIADTNNNTTTKSRLEHNNIYLNLSGFSRGFFADFSVNQSEKEEYHFWPSFSDGLLNRKNLTTFSFGHEKRISDHLTVKGTLKYYIKSYWREFDYFMKDFYGQEMVNSRKYEADINAIYAPSENFDIIAGVVYENSDRVFKLDLRDVYLLNTGSYSSNNEKVAFYSQLNYRFNKQLKFVAGGRLEKSFDQFTKYFNNETDFIFDYYYNPEKLELLPRLAMIYSINENHIVKLLYGKAIKNPTPDDIEKNMLSGSKNLESEYIDTYELNYISKIHDNITVNASYFHNELNNLLTGYLQFEEDSTWSPYVSNAGEIRTDGLEITINAKPAEKVLFELSGTYQKTKNKSSDLEDIEVGYSPNLLANLKVSYSITPDIILSMTSKFVDEMETHWDATTVNPDTTFGARVADKVDSYLLNNVNIRVNNIFDKKYYLNLSCKNIFDKEYLYPLYTSNRAWADKGVFGDRRTFLITFGWKY